MRIAGIQGLSLIDFPGNVASVLFLAGCDFRCPFCQNPDLIEISADTPKFSWEDVVEFLRHRKKLIDGVAITGGEPMLFPDIADFVAHLNEEIGLPVKIDTNGHHPDVLKQLLEDGHVTYVAMDVKTALSRYSEASGTLVDIHKIEQSIRLIMQSGVRYEFRTTVVPTVVDEAAVDEMGKVIEGAELWAFQQYQNRIVYNENFKAVKPLTPEKVRALMMRAEPYVKRVIVRGL
ncbi:MAG: anaerobic ribonucleoside-triphosphate reductase activating protein [Candidatus Lernaella stagnicola]|nr:anaerobic ribonucleoside-triphosphate reductase activating protein [Candidatus Lernaella stagnicola]